MNLIGLTKNQATSALNSVGITDIVFVVNAKNTQPNSTLLVTSCKIINNTAHVVLGSFILDL